jgi:hypothetical protein
MVTYTPVPYWLDRPIFELDEWLQVAISIQKKRRRE